MEKESSNDVITITTRKIDLTKRSDKFVEEKIAVESPVHLFLNEKPLTVIMASPSKLRELAFGFIIDEGVIPHRKEIQNIIVKKNEVWIKSKKINQERCRLIRQSGVISTSCSSKSTFYKVIGELHREPLQDIHYLDSEDILQMVRESISKSIIFRNTGGVHSASIFVDGFMKGFAEDVGRHNAVDKVIGICLDNNISLERAVLITSGRQTADIVMKAARCRIPFTVSMRAPLSSGVYAAKLTGVTLISFVRGSRMNVYTNPERVKYLEKI